MLFVTRKDPPLNIRLERAVPVTVRGASVWVEKSMTTPPPGAVNNRRMPSLEKEKTRVEPEPLVQVSACPTVPVLVTVRVEPLRPVRVKFGTRVTVSFAAAMEQELLDPAQVKVTVPARVAPPIVQPPKVRVMTLFEHVPNVAARAQVVA